MYRIGRHGSGEVREGGYAAGAFQGRGDDDFEAAGAGAQGEFGAGEEAAMMGGFDDEAAHRRVAENLGVEQVRGFVDGEREVGARLKVGELRRVGGGQRFFEAFHREAGAGGDEAFRFGDCPGAVGVEAQG